MASYAARRPRPARAPKRSPRRGRLSRLSQLSRLFRSECLACVWGTAGSRCKVMHPEGSSIFAFHRIVSTHRWPPDHPRSRPVLDKEGAGGGRAGLKMVPSDHRSSRLISTLVWWDLGELLLSPLRDNTQLSIPLLSPPFSPLSLRWVSPFGRWPFVYKMEGYDWVPLLPMLLEVILVAGAARVARKSPGVAAVLGLLLAVGAGYASNKLWAVSSALSPLNVSDIRLWPATPAARRVCGLRY